MAKINQWQTPDWIKTLLTTIMAACIMGILGYIVSMDKSINAMDKTMGVLIQKMEGDKVNADQKFTNMEKQIDGKASKEDVAGVKQRVINLEKKVFK